MRRPGPGGSSTAYHLARAGLDVVLLEKSPFPRDKICGDGLTPAAVHELIAMGVDTTGWMRNRGLTVIGGGHTVHLDWPDQKSLPGYGMARARTDLDHALAKRAVEAGARLYEGVTVTGAIQDGSGRVVGVTAKAGRGKSAATFEVRASITVDAGGVAARLATSLGLEKKMNRPMGVAARAYFHSPRGDEEWMDPTSNCGAALPAPPTFCPATAGSSHGQRHRERRPRLRRLARRRHQPALPRVFKAWTENLPEEVGLPPPRTKSASYRSAALPMSFNRKPHYVQGLVLVGDAGGMVSPYNGEGIAPAMKAGRYAASCIAQALSRSHRAGIDRAMSEYPHMLRDEYGGYYQLGRIFVALIENPTIMRTCTNVGLPIPRLMTLVHKLLSDGYERSGGDFDDQLITMLTKVVRPA